VSATTRGALPELLGNDGLLGVSTDNVDEMSWALQDWRKFNREKIYSETSARFRSEVEVAQMIAQAQALLRTEYEA
jgi:glycosyltransferase involved in cell wall biosynthesis